MDGDTVKFSHDEEWLRRMAKAEDEAGCINIGNPIEAMLAAAYGYHAVRIADHVVLACYRTAFGNGRLVIFVENDQPRGSWCYPSLPDAITAMTTWENPKFGERPPDGWFREIHTGTRRENGDPAKEYHQP